ncbi:MAG TPA: MFS transporter [Baekduia sp.]|uniref:MFS transporter n=1 Tax=Baekduia sp. TaxID=2600305 RepID=UPI002D78B5A4|nr:MFS transporter [Baekduia sp.]HET6508214.1 MFS transporter [Baekduia sp.]
MTSTTLEPPAPLAAPATAAGVAAADAAPEAKAGPASRAVWTGFAVVLAASVMDLLDATIAQTAAPAIRVDLGGSYATIEWVTAAYTLAMATGLLLGGRLGDLLGRRNVLLGGMAAFTFVSVLCALAPSPDALIGARALQGLAAALMVPQCFGLIRELFGDEGQQRAFSIFGPVMGLGAVAGPLLGGAIVDADILGTGWRAIFLINVPVGLGALLVGRAALPRTKPVAPGGRLDLPSVLLAMAGGFAIVYPLVEGRELGWPAWCVAMPIGGLALLAAFAALQARRHRNDHTTLVEPSLLRRRPYVSGLALVATFIGAMGGMVLSLNVMFQNGLGFSPLACGVATAAIPLAAIGGSIASAVLVGKLGRTVLWIGLTTMAAGLVVTDLVLRAQGADLSAWETAAPLTLTGFGMGMIFMPMFDVVLAGVQPHQLGSASGLLESIQQLGMSIGIAVVGTVLFDVVGSAHGPAAFVGAADHALLVGVGLLAVAAVTVAWLPRHARAEGGAAH